MGPGWSRRRPRSVVGVVVEELELVVVLEVDVELAVYWPTEIVTVLPFLAVELPPGDWLTTIPFSLDVS